MVAVHMERHMERRAANRRVSAVFHSLRLVLLKVAMGACHSDGDVFLFPLMSKQCTSTITYWTTYQLVRTRAPPSTIHAA
jgi:hypothetical protein